MKVLGRTKNMRIPLSMMSRDAVKRDAIILPAVFVFNCFSFSAWTQLGQLGTKPWLLLVWLYGLVVLIPLAWRDKAPLTVFATQCVFTVAAWKIFPLFTPMAGIPIALYAVSVHYPKAISLPALLVSFISNGLDAAVAFRVHKIPAEQISSFAQNAVFLVLVAFGAWASGVLTQASQRRVDSLEREKKTAQEAVVEERRRIARELHDSVSHAVTVMVLQAAGAARVAETDFAEVMQSLANIEFKGKQAIAELQRLLGVLHGGGLADDTTDTSGLRPQPGLADLPRLLTSLPALGRRIVPQVEGTPQELDPSVDLAAYRIVQEGLTNVFKHAGEHANPQLRLTWQADTLLVRIDNGTNLAKAREQGASGGHGLVGLCERVHAVGGQLDARPHPGAGYRLDATLPLSASSTHPGTLSAAAPGSADQARGDY